MLRNLLAASLLCLTAGQADAANKAFINEYNAIGNPHGQSAQIAQEPPVAVQTPVDFSGGAAQSAALNAATNYVLIQCDSQCSYRVGTNPAATTSDMPLAAFTPFFFAIKPGMLISVVAHP
jgi:hypothetical protein